jgi:membrane-associated protein
VGIGAAALASWVGFPGPGEAILATAGVLAAHHRLDIGAVVAVAWVGATLGGIAGWLVGLKGGRAIVTRRGPLRQRRLKVLARGERFFDRYGAQAVFFTPSWVAGISRMRGSVYLPANAVSALVWALLVGLGAYFIGPSIADIVGDLGRVGTLILSLLALVTFTGELLRRRKRSRPGSRGAGRP